MKVQKKLLTKEQKQNICDQVHCECEVCPLNYKLGDKWLCHDELKELLDTIQKWWCEEVDYEQS